MKQLGRTISLLLIYGCSGCTTAVTATAFRPAILRDSLPDGKGAVTVCAENNVPYIVLGWELKGTDVDEGLRVHELEHVRQAIEYRGGCWPFVYRYRSDTAFRNLMEYQAYCAWGKWMLEHNRQPQEVWEHIRRIMWVRYQAVVRNCLYEPWEG